MRILTLKRLLCLKWAIRRALKKLGPKRYQPQETGIILRNDYTYVNIFDPIDMDKSYIVLSQDWSNGILGLIRYNESSDSRPEICLPWKLTEELSFEFSRVCGIYKKEFNSPFWFLLSELICFPWMQHIRYALYLSLRQKLFNLYFRPSLDRMKILEKNCKHASGKPVSAGSLE